MLLLNIDFGTVLPAALFGAVLALLVFAAMLLVLHFCGIRVFWRKKLRTRKSVGTPVKSENAAREGELSEEELLVILSAAAIQTLSADNAKRFRVVSFRRI